MPGALTPGAGPSIPRGMLRTLLVASIAAVALCCGNPATPPEDSQLDVWVSIPPQRQILESVGGNALRVEVLLPPGRSPATFEISPQRLTALQGADVLVVIGVPFEEALVPRLRSVAPDLRIVEGHRGIERRPMKDDHGHGHGEVDPHIWLDPVLVDRLAGNARDTLCELSPERCGGFTSHLESYRAQLAAAHRRIRESLGPFEGRTLLVFHPAYGYFASRYGLDQLAVEVEGREPSARQLAELVEIARRQGLRDLFVQPELAGRSADAVAEAIGGEVVLLDPLAPDLVDNLERMASRIATALDSTEDAPGGTDGGA